MSAKYLIRLDDACPTFQLEKWQKFFDLFDEHNIKPIIAVIPHNEDKTLQKGSMSEKEFWQVVKQWENSGWCVAIHGYEHKYVTKHSGIFNINKRSEFAGLSIEEQLFKINKAKEIFNSHSLKGEVFIAPSHSLDKNTVFALKKNGIKIISDGIYTHPYIKMDMSWIPCQLSYPKKKKTGVWTICYHPETISDNAFEQLSLFVKANKADFIDVQHIKFTSVTFIDYYVSFLIRLKNNRLLSSIIYKLRNL